MLEFIGVVSHPSEGEKPCSVYEFDKRDRQLSDGEYQYGLSCPLDNPPRPSTLTYPQRRDDVICPGCGKKYLMIRKGSPPPRVPEGVVPVYEK